MSKGVYKRFGAAIGMKALFIGKTNRQMTFMETYTICDVYEQGYVVSEVPGYGFLRRDFLLLSKD